MESVDVICIGNASVDVPLRYVNEDIFTTDSYSLESIKLMVGGSAMNVSTILTNLGKTVKLIAMLGNDLLGDFVIKHCLNIGIDVSHIIRNKEVDTPLNIGLVRPDGERTFIVGRNSSTFHFSSSDIDTEGIKNAKLLHFASIFIMPHFEEKGLSNIFSKAKDNGIIVCADMMKSRQGERLNAIVNSLVHVDYFFSNYDEASFLTGLSKKEEIAYKLMECGIKNVIIKCGEKGCYIKNGEFETECPTFVNKNVADTIGAGDNFAAGFITGILDGLSFIDCARFANATASISVGSAGAVSGVKNKQQVINLILDN